MVAFSLSSVLSVALLATSVVASEPAALEPRKGHRGCSYYDMNIVKYDIAHPVYFCKWYNLKYRILSPIPRLNADDMTKACWCIIAEAHGKRDAEPEVATIEAPVEESELERRDIPGCNHAKSQIIKAEFRQLKAFFNFFNTGHKRVSPVKGLESPLQVLNAAHCVLFKAPYPGTYDTTSSIAGYETTTSTLAPYETTTTTTLAGYQAPPTTTTTTTTTLAGYQPPAPATSTSSSTTTTTLAGYQAPTIASSFTSASLPSLVLFSSSTGSTSSGAASTSASSGASTAATSSATTSGVSTTSAATSTPTSSVSATSTSSGSGSASSASSTTSSAASTTSSGSSTSASYISSTITSSASSASASSSSSSPSSSSSSSQM